MFTATKTGYMIINPNNKTSIDKKPSAAEY
jgi:hypothetical protein